METDVTALIVVLSCSDAILGENVELFSEGIFWTCEGLNTCGAVRR